MTLTLLVGQKRVPRVRPLDPPLKSTTVIMIYFIYSCHNGKNAKKW